jgi:hypothetical protein
MPRFAPRCSIPERHHRRCQRCRPFRVRPSQFLSGAVNDLWSVSAPSATGLWAAGGGYRTLVMHFCPKG